MPYEPVHSPLAFPLSIQQFLVSDDASDAGHAMSFLFDPLLASSPPSNAGLLWPATDLMVPLSCWCFHVCDDGTDSVGPVDVGSKKYSGLFHIASHGYGLSAFQIVIAEVGTLERAASMLSDSHSTFPSLRSFARGNNSPSLWLQFAIECVIACLKLRAVGQLNVVKPSRTADPRCLHVAPR